MGQFEYLMAKRKLKRMQATKIIETQTLFDKNKVKHMLEDPSIRLYLFSKKLLHDQTMQKRFNEAISKYV
ncbi:hypothetical protein [Anoxybacillus flavithermus]|uniref:hypothetical protein n=1 Tax=Anoxybacillus flavithermus TaxID=33934 RepID=UPI001FCAF3CE|nr:hypothetical protein [Anoxybacillus flavithermus]